MRLSRVFARFYKSFNFDHLRKAHREAEPLPWEYFRDAWFPYVEVRLDAKSTAIVGANESGKSHLLEAIEKAISGEGFKQRDLCRYSPFFNVERGKTCWPHLGLELCDLDADEQEAVKQVLEANDGSDLSSLLLFREGPEDLTVYLATNSGYAPHAVSTSEKREAFSALLPKTFRIKADVALPGSISLEWLVNPNAENRLLQDRQHRARLAKAGAALSKYWSSDQGQLANSLPKLIKAVTPFLGTDPEIRKLIEAREDALLLARNLLVNLAEVEPERLHDLQRAVETNDDGHANALMARINDQLARKLNFPKWWVQDREFALQVTLREQDLVFTVRDRTGTEYTFDERSSGLKYFLSYLIQSRVRTPDPSRPEILLMDEPDAYLSAEAQQDLLKIFQEFAEPTTGVRSVQVVYVTHSPFLLDKNHAERIRVLQKGKGRDGTQVIRNAAQNHYEPLRSAFGAFVGETAFVGACNLLVEGASDQILLAGLARISRRAAPGLVGNTLDLNRMVIVPCGSASQVPYMLYLIRGRDAEKPPVVVLLDSDSAGIDAARLMTQDDRRARKLTSKEFVLLLGHSDEQAPGEGAPTELEDLAPSALLVAAANESLLEIARYAKLPSITLTADALNEARKVSGSAFKALDTMLREQGVHVEKIALARNLVRICEHPPQDVSLEAERTAFVDAMQKLFVRINRAREKAERAASRERLSIAIDRAQRSFLQDWPRGVTREIAGGFVDRVEELLDDSLEADAVWSRLLTLRKAFSLDQELAEQVGSYEDFRFQLSVLKDSLTLESRETHSA